MEPYAFDPYKKYDGSTVDVPCANLKSFKALRICTYHQGIRYKKGSFVDGSVPMARFEFDRNYYYDLCPRLGMPIAGFSNLMACFKEHCQNVLDAHTLGHDHIRLLEQRGSKYVRLIKNGKSQEPYVFVDQVTGNIFKPASPCVPNKVARGNIADPKSWDCIGPLGIACR